MTGMPRQMVALAAVAVLLAAALAGCRREPGPEDLRRAWKFASERMVEAALPLVKDYLAAHPGDAAAHYVLGKCYLHRPDVNTTLAKGEFETALYCFGKTGDLGVLAPEMLTAELFQSAIHRDIALALMRALYEGDGQLPGPVMLPVLNLALQHVRDALGLDPSSGFLLEMEKSLEALRQGRPSPTPLPRQSATPGEITI